MEEKIAVTFNVSVGNVDDGISAVKQIREQIPNATVNVFINHVFYNVADPNFSSIE